MARDADLEIWENPTESLIGLVKLDHRGVQTDVLVNPGRKVSLTPEEREINESMCVSDELNPFRNGFLRPVRLVESPDAAPAVVTPNARSNDELGDLLKKNGAALTKALSEIDSEVTLRRLEEIATAKDASIKQVEAIQARIVEVAPKLDIQQNERVYNQAQQLA